MASRVPASNINEDAAQLNPGNEQRRIVDETQYQVLIRYTLVGDKSGADFIPMTFTQIAEL